MTMKKTKTLVPRTEQEHQDRLHELEEQAAELVRRLHAVRATRDLKPARASTEYFVGDEGPTPDLMATVQRMITARPMTFQEIKGETGARDNRIKGVLMRLQREGVRVVNMGTELRALWFIPSDEALKRLRARRR